MSSTWKKLKMSYPKVVFLIDECQESIAVVRHIHLSCLRILSFFANGSLRGGKQSSVYWGYKFYNTMLKPVTGFKACSFFEYGTDAFENFESELVGRLIKHWKPMNRAWTSPEPLNSLHIALTELLSDFHWQRPDMFSPQKSSALSRKASHDEKNFVFLFTSNLQYQDQKVICYGSSFATVSEFWSCFLPGNVLQKLVMDAKISLFCISCDSVAAKDDKKHSIAPCGEPWLLNSKQSFGVLVSLFDLSSWWQSCCGCLHTESCFTVPSCSLILHDVIVQRNHALKQRSVHVFPFKFAGICGSDASAYLTLYSTQSSCKSSLLPLYGANNCTFLVKAVLERSCVAFDLLDFDSCLVYMLTYEASDANLLCAMEMALRRKLVLLVEISSSSFRQFCIIEPHAQQYGILAPFSATKLLCVNGPAECESLVSKDVLADGIRKLIAPKGVAASDQPRGAVAGQLGLQASLSPLTNITEVWYQYHPMLSFSSSVKDLLRNRKQNLRKVRLNEASAALHSRLKALYVCDSVAASMERLHSIPNGRPHEWQELLMSQLSGTELDNQECMKYRERSLSHENDVKFTVPEFSQDCMLPCGSLSPGADPVQEVLHQVNLLLETICANQSLEEKLVEKVVCLLQGLVVVKSPKFVRDHIQFSVLPRYKDVIPQALEKMYEGLMLEMPEDLVTVLGTNRNQLMPTPSLTTPTSVGEQENVMSAHEVPMSQKAFPRRSSILGLNSAKRTIPLSRPRKALSKSACYEKANNNQNLPAVPETPKSKQVNKLLWKKQQLQRRHSCVDNNNGVVGESPLKGNEVALVSQERTVSMPRRCSSGYLRSPRRFYTGKGILSTCSVKNMGQPKNDGTPSKITLHDSPNVVEEGSRLCSIDDACGSTIFNFFGDGCSPVRSLSNPIIREERGPGVRVVKRSIFQFPSRDSNRSRTKRKRISDDSESLISHLHECMLSSECQDRLEDDVVGSFSGESRVDSGPNPVFLSRVASGFEDSQVSCTSETTVDWLAQVAGADFDVESLSFSDLLENLKPQSSTDQYSARSMPMTVHTGSEKISVCPSVCMSSLQILEHAPILSPSLRSSVTKSSSSSTCSN